MPAQVRVVDAAGIRDRHYWQPDPIPRLRYRRDEDYAEHFLEVMGRAVARRLRAVGRPAVLMSGGLDSTTIAALAAEHLAPRERLRTYSYVFDTVTVCDERRYMAPMIERFDLDAVQVLADDAWTFARLDGWPHNPSGPDGNCYRDLIELVFDAVRADGVRVVLAGYGADELYCGMEYWLVDLLADRRFRAAGRQMARHLRHLGPRKVLASQTVRRLSGEVLAGLGRRGGRRSGPARPWLTPWAAALVPDQSVWPPWVAAARRPNQHDAVLGADVIAGAAATGCLMHMRGVEVRHPYCDRDVVEFFLQLPAYLLFADGRTKIVVRQAMQGRLPEAVRLRSIPTSFDALYTLGVQVKALGRAQALLAAADTERARFVRADWLAHVAMAEGLDDDQAMARWRCLARAVWIEQGKLVPDRHSPVESLPWRTTSPSLAPTLEAKV
jgi:asparagine synthase (glutamine-hydrolysing)